MRHDLSDADVLTFALAGCNAEEIAAYAGIPVSGIQPRLARVLRLYANPQVHRQNAAFQSSIPESTAAVPIGTVATPETPAT